MTPEDMADRWGMVLGGPAARCVVASDYLELLYEICPGCLKKADAQFVRDKGICPPCLEKWGAPR